MTITMTKRLEFDAGHRLMNHESKCRNIHGHRYVCEVTIELVGHLDHAGRIVDFGDVKRIFGGWIDENLDHGFIANAADAEVIALCRRDGSRLFVMPCEPSAEHLAVFLLSKARAMLDVVGERRVVSLVLHETPTGRAEAR